MDAGRAGTPPVPLLAGQVRSLISIARRPGRHRRSRGLRLSEPSRKRARSLDRTFDEGLQEISGDQQAEAEKRRNKERNPTCERRQEAVQSPTALRRRPGARRPRRIETLRHRRGPPRNISGSEIGLAGSPGQQRQRRQGKRRDPGSGGRDPGRPGSPFLGSSLVTRSSVDFARDLHARLQLEQPDCVGGAGPHLAVGRADIVA